MHIHVFFRTFVTMKCEVLVIHVRGQEERRQFIEQQLKMLNAHYHFILNGNIEDLTDEILNRFFDGDMHGGYPRTSCAYKHLLAMQYMIDHHLDHALVVEDDLRFYRNFQTIFEQSIRECTEHYDDQPFIVNYEESSLLLVPRSQRRKGTIVYPAPRDRFAGCYYLNLRAANAIMDYVTTHHSDTTSDRLHSHLVDLGILNYYWSHPCIACQCSCDGSMPTMIPTRPRPLKRLKWFYKRVYKHLLYYLR